MPGAFSRASHSVTRNSVANCLVLSSSSVASDICMVQEICKTFTRYFALAKAMSCKSRDTFPESAVAESYLEHCIHYLGEVLPEEPWVRLCNLDEKLKRLLRCALIPGLQRVPDDCQLLRDGGLESVPLCWLLQFLKIESM